MTRTKASSYSIVYFDGVCNLCHYFINFIIRNDSSDYFRLSQLQSESGAEFCSKHGLPTENFQTIYLYENGIIYSHSTAIFKIFKKLKNWYFWVDIFMLIPKRLRDNVVYRIISKNRYSIFGSRDECLIPSKDVLRKFI